MVNYVCNNKEAGYNMYHDPKGFEEQCYSCFPYCEDRNIMTVVIGLTHEVSGGSSPNTF